MRVLCLLVMALLAGCGQKGPLYFADKQPAKAAPPAQNAPATQDASSKKKDDKQDDHSDRN